MSRTATHALSESQKVIWLGQSMTPHSPMYNMVWRVDLRGQVDPRRFIEAWAAVVTTTDALRLRIVQTGSEPAQSFSMSGPDLRVLDLRDNDDPYGEVEAWVKQDALIPFDLATETTRAALLRIADDHWVWYLNQHHICTDAGSGKLIWQRLVSAYQGNQLADAPSFADYVDRISSGAAFTAAEIARQDWERRFAGAPGGHSFYGRKIDLQRTSSCVIDLEFGPARVARLDAITQLPQFRSFSADLSRFCVLTGLLGAFLARVKGEERVTLGVPAHNRRTPLDKDTVGFLVEVLPMRVETLPGESLETLFAKVHTEAVKWIKGTKPGVVSPALFNANTAALNYIQDIFAPFPGAERTVQWLPVGAHDSNQEVRLHLFDFNGTGHPVVRLEIKSELLGRIGINAIGNHFLHFLDGALSAPDKPLWHIPLVDPAHGEGSILVGSQTGQPATVMNRFYDLATRHPDEIALSCGTDRISYAELAFLVDDLSAGLAARGVSLGDCVAIHLRRSLDTVVAMLAVWRAGAYFTPLPADTPKARLDKVLSQLGAKLTIVDAATQEKVDPAFCPFLSDMLKGSSHAISQTSGDMAYVLFTSGSTGIPKGVEVTTDALARYIDWAARNYGGSGPISYPFFSSVGFDLTLTSLFVPLVTGGTVHIYPEASDGPDLAVLEVFDDDAVDVVKLTPAHLKLVTQHAKPARRISTLVLGGENLTRAACEGALSTLGRHIRILNEYGPTEAVVGCMKHVYDSAKDLTASVSIGGPADDVVLVVVDPGMNVLPLGVAGELLIGGARLARGYHKDPALTEARFKSGLPFHSSRFYRSGDLVRMLPDGTLEYLGREDDQVKISGIRVEPAEVTAALLAQDAVADAIVLPFDPTTDLDNRNCVNCGLSGNHPDSQIDATGTCRICRDFEQIKDRASVYFEPQEELTRLLDAARQTREGSYDAIMLFSGGKDSAYALYRLAELTPDILVLTLDNGFISEGAKANIKRICSHLGLDHRFLRTPAMNAIFRDSLDRFSNVCQGCFKTIYALAIQTAQAEGIPAIVTGLSRGQFFETRLTVDLFAKTQPTRRDIDLAVLNARRAYHQVDDAVSRELGTDSFICDEALSDIIFIDIYRYLDVPVSEIYSFLSEHAPWSRPEDTGRSTNCLINDAGIHVHKRREGYHNYALPYSWDVRLGHKTRSEALAELDDDIDEAKVGAILREIGYTRQITPRHQRSLVAYVVTREPLNEQDILSGLRRNLPREMLPSQVIFLSEIPLTANGKVATDQLPKPALKQPTASGTDIVSPSNELEQQLATIYANVIGVDRVDVTKNIYDLGGDSIAAIQIAMLANEGGIALRPNSVFEHQTVRSLAAYIAEVKDTQDIDFDSDIDLLELDENEMSILQSRTMGDTS